jgi:hypothetical protein
MWLGLRNPTQKDRKEAHETLHAATMQYFEILQPYLATAPSGSKARDIWLNARLVPVARKTEPGTACENGHVFDDPDAAGKPCSQCGAPLQQTEVPQVADDGRPIGEWETGLRLLAEHGGEVKTVETESSDWSTGTETVRVPVLLNPDVLIRACRYLDEAAVTLGLLAETEDSRPLAEV